MELILGAGLLILFIMQLDVRSRIGQLEERMRRDASQAQASSATAPLSQDIPLREAVQGTAASVVRAQPQEPDALGALGAWLKDEWLLKLGAFLLLLGFGWLASYAFMNGWIGPMGRIAIGLTLGACIMLLGFWRIPRYVVQGGIFLVLGSTTILLTTYAARELYDFFTPVSALALMFGTSAFVALASVLYERKALAVASVALMGVAPLLTHSPNPDAFGLFSYLAIVLLGSLVITWARDYREVTTTALIVVALYNLPYITGFESAPLDILVWFGFGFGLLFYVTNTAGLMRLKGTDASADLLTAAGSAALLAAWI